MLFGLYLDVSHQRPWRIEVGFFHLAAMVKPFLGEMVEATEVKFE